MDKCDIGAVEFGHLQDRAGYPEAQRVGAAIPRETLPAVELRATGNGALRAMIPHHAGGAIGVAKHLVDSRGSICTARRFADGTTRCEPESMQSEISHYYTDSACSDGQLVAIIFSDRCARPPTFVGFFSSMMCDSQVTSVHEILATTFTGPIFGRYAGVCRQTPTTPSIPMNRLGPAVSLDSFAPIVREVE